MRAHIIGLAGSGKTTLAGWLGDTFRVPTHDLDDVAYGEDGARTVAEVDRRVGVILSEGRWVTEGAYSDQWVEPLLTNADVIVWLDIGVSTCLFRMLKRHLRAELTRSNKHRGWIRLLRFMNYTRESARGQRERTRSLLAPYTAKVRHCGNGREVDSMRESLASATMQ